MEARYGTTKQKGHCEKRVLAQTHRAAEEKRQDRKELLPHTRSFIFDIPLVEEKA